MILLFGIAGQGFHGNSPAYPSTGAQPAGYPQQPGAYNPVHPQQPSYIPVNGGQQPAPVVNNYYGGPGQLQPQQSSGGGSGLQTALLAGVGGLSLYNALKPNEQKTVIIHENAPAPAAAPAPAVAPAAAPAPAVVQNPPVAYAPAPAAVQPQPFAPAPAAPMYPQYPQAPVGQVATDSSPVPSIPPLINTNTAAPATDSAATVPSGFGTTNGGVSVPPSPESGSTLTPLAPAGSPQPIPLAPSPENPSQVPLAPLAPMTSTDYGTTGAPTTMFVPSSPQPNAAISAQTTTGVPLAAYPNGTGNDIAHAPLKGAAANLNGFNLALFSCVTLVITQLL